MDYHSATGYLSVKWPLFPHEIASGITASMIRGRSSDSSRPDPDHGGSVYVSLLDGSSKSADFCLFDPTLRRTGSGRLDLGSAHDDACPTVVWEVGLSESPRKLGRDCARWVGASEGRVNLAIGVHIRCKKGTEDTTRIVSKITVTEWIVEKVYSNDKSEESKDSCNILRRTDRQVDAQPAKLAGSYKFSTKIGKIVTWKVRKFPTEVSPLLDA